MPYKVLNGLTLTCMTNSISVSANKSFNLRSSAKHNIAIKMCPEQIIYNILSVSGAGLSGTVFLQP